jgi:hypothetical protein
MRRDYEDIGLSNLDDREIRELVRVDDGVIVLSGRVGTPEELRVAERIVTDVIGANRVRSELVVDPIRRDTTPEGIDEHLTQEDRESGLLLGDMPEQHDPSASTIHGDRDARLHGTTDVGHAIEEGATWIPPESPTPEGHGEGEEDRP